MDLNVPTAFTQVTRCFATNVLEDGTTLVGICTTSGQFLEFVDKKLVDSYEIDEDADELNIFTSYNPLQKYYLIRCQKKLIVMKRNKPLCVVKTYDGVTRMDVRDRLGIGRPQAVIWVESERQPIVTDFVNQLTPLGPQPVPALTTGLSTKLQEMNLRLEKARKVLRDKKKTRLLALYNLCPHDQPPVKVDDGSAVLAWGPGPPPPTAAPLSPLQVSRPWRKTHNDKWIVGVPLFNQSDTTVEDVRLRLSSESDPNLTFKTQLLVFPQRSSQGTLWSEPKVHHELFIKQDTVPPQTAAVLIGVLDAMPFKTSSAILISGVVVYRKKSSTVNIQNLLGSEIQFSVEDLVQGVLETFAKSDPEDDDRSLLSAIVSSSCYQLKVGASLPVPTTLQMSDLGLRTLCTPSLASASDPCYWVGSAPGGLRGLVVACHPLSSSQYRLDVYAKDVKLALLLVHGLGCHLRVEEWRPDHKTSVSDCARSLFDELRLLLSAAQHPTPDFTPEAWANFKCKLSTLELKTDLDFQLYSSTS